MRPLIVVSMFAVAVAASAENPLSAEETRDGFTALFNGKDLDGWWIRGGDKGFEAKDGLLISTGETGGDWIFTDNEYENFILRYEYRVQPEGEGNSGVGIRAPKEDNPAFSGMEIQVIRPNWPVPYQRSGALYSTVPPQVAADNPAGEWNAVEVLADGPRIRTTMNGKVLYDIKMTDYTEDKDWQKKLTDRAPKGHIALQNHNNRVEFRNLRIKVLPSSGAHND